MIFNFFCRGLPGTCLNKSTKNRQDVVQQRFVDFQTSNVQGKSWNQDSHIDGFVLSCRTRQKPSFYPGQWALWDNGGGGPGPGHERWALTDYYFWRPHCDDLRVSSYRLLLLRGWADLDLGPPLLIPIRESRIVPLSRSSKTIGFNR